MPAPGFSLEPHKWTAADSSPPPPLPQVVRTSPGREPAHSARIRLPEAAEVLRRFDEFRRAAIAAYNAHPNQRTARALHDAMLMCNVFGQLPTPRASAVHTSTLPTYRGAAPALLPPHLATPPPTPP